MKKLFLSVITITLTFIIAFGQEQKGVISFKTLEHNYGIIKEEAGPVDYKFIFSNTGNKPLLINNVKPSCGCTTSDYSKNPIAPGQTGYVIARYDPNHRPGKFNKSITVTTNAENATTVLRINGEVIQKPKTLDDKYPKAFNKIKLTTDHVGFTKILNSEVKTEEIEFVNTSNELVKLDFEMIPEFVSIKVIPEVVKPEYKGKIVVQYDAAKANDFGLKMSKVIVKENGEINNKNRLTISANIYEDFSKLSEEDINNAPIASFDKRLYNYETIKQGDIVHASFKLTNSGKNDLIIRKTKTSCGCTIAKTIKDVLKTGESTSIDITFNSRGKKGKQPKNITVYTNDPKNSVIMLKLSGNIEL